MVNWIALLSVIAVMVLSVGFVLTSGRPLDLRYVVGSDVERVVAAGHEVEFREVRGEWVYLAWIDGVAHVYRERAWWYLEGDSEDHSSNSRFGPEPVHY